MAQYYPQSAALQRTDSQPWVYAADPGHDYPSSSSSFDVKSVPPCPPFTTPTLQRHPDPYAAHGSAIAHSVSITQVDSNIGPSRVLTRRQRAALEQAPMPRRASGPPPFPHENALQRHPTMYLTSPVSVSRPQTPNQDAAPYEPQREPLTLSVPAAPVMQPSPSYHPVTPSSCSSPYSSYGFYSTTHSRSNSLSNSTNPRSASPALSTASALTSISSGSVPNSFALPPPESTLAASRAKHKKQRLFNLDRKQICEYQKENPTARQEDIARIYGVERSTISKILKNKTKWLNVPANEGLKIAKHRPSKFPEVEEEMVKWLMECRDTNTVLSDSMIRVKAKEIAREIGIHEDKFKASAGWIENFKHRHGVRSGVWTGDGKNNRAARALGLGPPEHEPMPILSPLNPAFDDDDAMDGTESHFSGEQEHPPELSPEPEGMRTRQMARDIPVRPSWLLSQHPHAADPLPPPPPQSSVSVHPSVPPSRQLPDHSQRQAPPYGSDRPVYDVVYQAPPLPENQPTTLEEAEVAINKLISFIDTSGHGILQPNERSMLTTIKCALFQAASGIPYDRGEGR